MSEFEILTKYIPEVKDGTFGEWIIDCENDGTTEHPIQIPYVDYSDMIYSFLGDLADFKDRNKDLGLYDYKSILHNNGIEWNSEAMSEAEVNLLNGQCIMALITGAARADRFCEGALLDFFEDGSILKWLERLKEIDAIY